ncbi:hypothetical protein EJ07DRAFT_172541 [Lizonia empirigonia]|nr:hypothetical protein EJ07DRAFT_172541 [Lizonia empirigonia]
MPDPANASFRRDSVPRSSDQASQYPAQAYGRYDAPEGNAYAPGGYATPSQAFPQDVPLTYPDRSPQLPQQTLPGPLASYHGFDPYAQATWDWTQPAGFTDFAASQAQPQGDVLAEPHGRKNSADEFSIPPAMNPLSAPPRPLPQRPAISPAMKRKSDAETQPSAQPFPNEHQNPSKRRAVSHASSTASQSSPVLAVLADAQPSPVVATNVAKTPANQLGVEGNGEALWRKGVGKGTGPQGKETDVSEPRIVVEASGAETRADTSRAPSYFSHFFSDQLHNSGDRTSDVRTLYIDRDPETFRDIALHLQGYHVVPRDGEHFVKLFADAQFYSLPRLTKQLFKSDIFVSIGGTPFRIPRSTFSAPGDSPNYFSLGFAQWFTTPMEAFPGLDRAALLRPPSILPPSVPNKSGEIFSELMKLLQGYDIEIRSEVHRSQLLKDARYFHLKGLEQRLIPCEISHNLKRNRSEILIRLEDIRQSGISFSPDTPPQLPNADTTPTPGHITYARPYTDDATASHTLILETSTPESTTFHLPAPSPPGSPHTSLTAHATFHADTQRRITALLSVIASKLGLPPPPPSTTPTSADPSPSSTSSSSSSTVAIRLDPTTALTLDGARIELPLPLPLPPTHAATPPPWIVRRAQWRVRVEAMPEGKGAGMQVVFCAVKVDAFTREEVRNGERRFLGGG